MSMRSAPRQTARGRCRTLLVAGEGREKFAPPSPLGRSRLVPPMRRHQVARGVVGRGVGHGGGNLPEPCDLGFRALWAVNGVADSATPFAPGLLVTAGENFPTVRPGVSRPRPATTGVQNLHPVRPGGLPHGAAKFAEPFPGQRGWKTSAPAATADGGGNLAPPCDLGFYRSAPLTVPPR